MRHGVSGVVSRDLILNFGTPLLSREWLKLEACNFVCIYTTADPIKNYAK